MSTAIERVPDFTVADREDCHRLDGLINQSLEHMFKCIEYLAEYKRRKFYLMDHASWQEYCDKRLRKSRAYVFRLMQAAEVRKALPPADGHSQNVANLATSDLRESHARELAKLPEEQRSEALVEATRAAGKKEPTAAGIKAAVDKMLGKTADNGELAVVDGNGVPVPRQLRDVFTKAADIEAFRRTVSTQKGGFAKLIEGPGGEVLAEHRQEFLRDRENQISVLKFSRPWAVCPYCGGRKSECDACKGRGWVIKETFDMAPKN